MVMEDDTEINKCSTSQCETGNYDNVSENSAQQTSNKFEQLKNQIKQANVSTKRPYADIQSETYSTEIRNNKRANNSQLQEKKFKPPPIHIHNQSTKSTIALVKGIEINNFEVNRVSKDKHSIILKNMDDYNKTKEILNEVNTKYFSYTPKDVKPKTLVLKGLSEEENIDELKVELKNLGKNKIINIIQLKTKRSSAINRKLPLYIVQFEANALLSRIYNIQFINYQRISWEQLEKKRNIMQCKNCQRFNHSAANCKLDYRCVKCASIHKPGECPVKEKVENSTIFCINCKMTGHPATYRGCPVYLQILHKLKNKLNEKRKDSRLFQSTLINTEIGSYADAVKNKTTQNLDVLSLSAKVEKMAKTIQQQSEQIAQLLDIITKL